MQYSTVPRYASRHDTTRHTYGFVPKILRVFAAWPTQDFSKRSPMLCLGCPLLRHVLCSAASASSDHRKATLRQQGLPSFRTTPSPPSNVFYTIWLPVIITNQPTNLPADGTLGEKEGEKKSVGASWEIILVCQIYYINLPFLVLPNNAIQRSAHATRCEKNRDMHKTYVPYQNVGVTHTLFFYIYFSLRRCSTGPGALSLVGGTLLKD